ncbi:MAG: ABC transporter ATP-binding protein/permease [Saccharofermentans sp.]|nr:ABC transporter ATP-binding protein/permease [Saccharofermentans sp.]
MASKKKSLNINIATVKRLSGYIKGSFKLVVISSVFAIIAAVLSITIPFIVGKAIDCIGVSDVTTIIRYLLIAVGVIILTSIMQYALNRINNSIAYKVSNRIRSDVYGKISKLPFSFIDNSSVGSLQSMIINDCETVSDGLLLFLNQFFAGIVSIVFTLIMMLYIDWRIALLVLVCTPLSFVFAYFIANKSFKSFKAQSEIRAQQTAYISEMTNNLSTLHVNNAAEMICSEFNDINEKYRKIAGKAVFLGSMTNPGTRLINNCIYALVAFVGAFRVISQMMTVGSLSSVLAYANQFTKPFNDLSAVYTELSDSFACLDRIFEFLDVEEIDDNLSNTTNEDIWSNEDNFTIEFENVSFSYVEGHPVLKDVSFVVPAGCACAIVGPTGCGKTTLINLLMRYYEPESGRILINDTDIRDVPRNVLRKYIGVVAQDSWFKNGSVIENIKYGNNTISDEDAISIADTSGADSFIRKLPNKYNEDIDSSRDDISEGQRQLLSITRAMVADNDILILDEATSSVDVLTEVRIQNAVKELLNGRTGIIIAHRLSTIIDSDMIVVIENGKVSEIGKHNELINAGGFYSKLYESYTEN